MAGEKGEEEWSPKTRDDWKGLFSESFAEALTGVISKKEEDESKKGSSGEGSKEGGTGDNDAGGKPKGKSLGERLLGI